jgi:hypothetical protein
MNISQDEASRALQEIEASRAAMRRAIQTHRGHLYLWLWGCAWIAMSLANWAYDKRALPAILWVSALGSVATLVIGYAQGRQIRSKVDKRFIGVCATLLVFGYLVWPVLLGDLRSYDFRSYKAAYAYFTVLWMQLYMVGGIWFDNFWFWIGLAVTVLIVAALLLVPAMFWAVTLLLGLVLFGSGFYVRYGWR